MRIRFLGGLGLGALLLAVLPFAGLTAFAQPYFDDYVNANTTAALGRWANQWQSYQHWTGRYVAVGLSTLLNPLAWWPLATGMAGLRLVLAAALLTHLGAMRLFFHALLETLTEAAPGAAWLRWPAGGLALLVLALGLNAMPEPFSFLYWYAAVFVYQLAWAFTLGFVGAALRAVRLPAGPGRRRWGVGAALCLLAALGSNELTLIACGVLLPGLGWWVHQRHPAAWRLWLCWAGLAVAGAAGALAAPGNWQRAALTDVYPQAHRWLLLLPRAGLAVLHLAARPVVLLSALGLAAGSYGLGTWLRPQPIAAPPLFERLAMLVGFLALNTLGVVFIKLFWVAPLLGRISNLLVFVLLTSAAALALWLGTWWRPAGWAWLRGRLAGGLAVGGLLVGLGLGQAGRAWQEWLLVAPAYDQQMQARYALLRQARAQGLRTVAVPPLRLPAVPGVLVPLAVPGHPIEFSVEVKPDYAGNSELARYFGLRGVRRAAPESMKTAR